MILERRKRRRGRYVSSHERANVLSIGEEKRETRKMAKKKVLCAYEYTSLHARNALVALSISSFPFQRGALFVRVTPPPCDERTNASCSSSRFGLLVLVFFLLLLLWASVVKALFLAFCENGK